MANKDGVDDVNSTRCQLADSRYWEDVTVVWEIDAEGEPLVEVDHTSGDFKCYWCTGCDEEFDSFEEVKEHLNE